MGRGSSKAGGGGGGQANRNLNLTRPQESERAMRLQEALGSGYRVEYDSGESGLTRFYYNNTMYREVPNSEMSAERISVTDYAAPRSVLQGAPERTQRPVAAFKTKVQSDYVDYVKQQTKIDLNTARDAQFDTRSFFNIDVRELGKGNVENGNRMLRDLMNLNRKSSTYEATVEPNGQYRYAIRVKRK